MYISYIDNTIIDGIFCGEKFSRISRFRKNYTQKTKNYMVCTLFLTDSQKFNPAKYTTYTVQCSPPNSNPLSTNFRLF